MQIKNRIIANQTFTISKLIFCSSSFQALFCAIFGLFQLIKQIFTIETSAFSNKIPRQLADTIK